MMSIAISDKIAHLLPLQSVFCRRGAVTRPAPWKGSPLLVSHQIAFFRRTVLFLGLLATQICCWGTRLQAQEPSVPFGYRSHKLALTDVTVQSAAGKPLENATILIEGEKIAAIGNDVEIPADARVLSLKGYWVYPGFVDAASNRGLPKEAPQPQGGRELPKEETSIASLPIDRSKSLTPEFQAAEHVQLTEADRDDYRSAGFCAVQVVPTGRLIGGVTALCSTASLPRREILYTSASSSRALAIELRGLGGDAYPATLMGGIAHLRQAYLDAFAERDQRKELRQRLLMHRAVHPLPGSDPKLAAIAHAARRLDHMFLANSVDEIERVIRFKREFLSNDEMIANGDLIIRGAKDAWKQPDLLDSQNLKVIQEVNFGEEPKVEASTPKEGELPEAVPPLAVRQQRHQDWLETVQGLGKLHAEKIEFAISTMGTKNPEEALKNLRLAIRHGLPKEAALAALTRNAPYAGHNYGIHSGDLASLAVFNGPFEEDDSKVRYCIVQGQVYEYNKTAKPKAASAPSATDPAESPKSDVTGTWTVEIVSGEQVTRGELTLAQTGGQLSGQFSSAAGNGTLQDGKLKDQGVAFTIAIGAGDKAVALKFQGQLDGDHLTGELSTPFGSPTKWTATRQEDPPADALNPVSFGGIESNEPDTKKTVAQESADDQPVELEQHRRGSPSSLEPGNLLIRNATILTATGETLEKADLLVEAGLITAMGPDLAVSPPEGTLVIDASGRFIMPGIIDTHSHMMLVDVNEATDSIVCEVQMQDAIRTNDDAEYRNLATGMTTARLLHGSANTIGGQHAVVQLKSGATIEDHLLPDAPRGVKFALGENVKFRTSRFPNTRLGVEATINRAFYEAADYRRRWNAHHQAVAQLEKNVPPPLPPRRDLRLEALTAMLNHELFIHSHCYRSDEILMLLRVAETHGMRIWSLQHVLEGYKVAPEIVKHGASCSTFADHWGYKVEAYDATPLNAAILHEAGANVVIKDDFPVVQTPLTIEAAKTIRHGLPPVAALQAITRNAARELGLDERLGTLEIGKQADLAIFSGHPLNIYARCEVVVINGVVWFDRSQQPTAMSAAGAERSAKPAPVKWPSPKAKPRPLKMPSPEVHRIALVGGTVHPVDGPSIRQATLLIEGETIQAVGHKLEIPSDYTKVDTTGLQVYPGLIDAGSLLGLTEISKVRETSDYAESGAFQPDLVGSVAVNPDSEHLSVARAGGILTALTRPKTGRLSGQASLIQLEGWTAPEMTIEPTAGLVLNWPAGKNRQKTLDELGHFFDEAQRYVAAQNAATDDKPGPVIDPRYEAMRPYLKGEKPLLVEAYSRLQIEESLKFLEERNLKGILCGAEDAWKVRDQISKQEVPVILGSVFRSPQEDYDPYDTTWANAGLLHEAGVSVAFRSDDAAHAHTLPFSAGRSVAFGLPEDVALKAVTLTAAEVLGVGDRLGSLTPGKWATLIITNGSPLQPSTKIHAALIRGRTVSLENRQTRFAQKYRERLKQER